MATPSDQDSSAVRMLVDEELPAAKEKVNVEWWLALVGGGGAHVASFAVFAVMFVTLRVFNGGTAPLQWGSFLLHPLLMTLAFGVLAPIGTVAYATYERLLGLSHGGAKLAHAMLQFGAWLVGLLGICTMWIKHDALIATGVLGGEGQPPGHFQTGHSWVGVGVFAAFTAQWLGGLAAFALPLTTPSLRRALLPAHALLGCVAVFGSLATVCTGIISWRGAAGRGLDHKEMALKAASALVFLLAVLVTLALASKRH